MAKPLFQLTVIHFKEFYREPGILFWSIGFPILMAWGLGIAFTNKGELQKNIAVVEHNPHVNKKFEMFLYGAAQVNSDLPSDKIIEKKVNDGKLGAVNYKFIFTDTEKALLLLKRGTVPLYIEERGDSLIYHFDPANSEAHLTYLELQSAINKLQANSDASIEPMTQLGTRYIDFLIPGLIAMGLMMSTMWGIGYSLIEKRSKKLLRRMIATPMHRSTYLLSHFLARIVLSIIEAALLFIFAYYYFDIHIQGNVAALIILFLSGLVSFSGIAIFIASRTAKTEIGNGLINAVVMPMMIVSGVFFSYHNFPDAVIPFIKVLPLTMLADGIRSIFIEGAGFGNVIIQIFALNIIGIVFFAAGLKIYKWY